MTPAPTDPLLLGRDGERASIEGLLEDARRGRGGGLLLLGEPGIGKSTLLNHAVANADEMDTWRATGVAAEADLPYAVLHQLLRALLHGVDELPAPQARALKTALGLDGGEPAEPFLVSLAALTLVSQSAHDRAALCVVDDAHWADRQSLQALGFVARRLEAEPLALILAAREPTTGVVADGMTVMHVTGVDDAAAISLLASLRRSPTDPRARRELVRRSAGNPLALIELSRSTSPESSAPRATAGEPLRLTATLEQVFAERARRLDDRSRTLLLLAAAGEATPRTTLERAAAEVDPGERADNLGGEIGDLLNLDGHEVTFRHPLMRSAIYWAAEPQERRDAHRALATAFDGDEHAVDRRAWHAAQATNGPDEGVAAELERSAARALQRSGPLSAAATFERAAQLSPAGGDRARRLVAAAEAAWRGGEADLARGLLGRVGKLGLDDPALDVAERHLLGEIELRAGIPADALQLLPAVRDAARVSPERAVRVLLAATEAAFNAADLQAMADFRGVVSELAPVGDRELSVVAELFGLHARMREGAGRPDLSELLVRAAGLRDPELLLVAGGMAYGLGDDAAGRRLRTAAVARARAVGAAGTLALALEHQVTDELALARLPAAETAAQEGMVLARETGRANCACSHLAWLAEIAALRGEEEQARELADRALVEGLERRLVKAVGVAHRALGMLALGAGRPAAALEHFEAIGGDGSSSGNPLLALTAAPDRIEAAVRSGQPERVAAALTSFVAFAGRVGSHELQALTCRSQALLAPAGDTDGHFVAALRHHTQADRPFDHARTALLYGEHLRRERRRVEGRAHLRAAMEAFERLGTPAWADRARGELRATGETARKRVASTLDDLTPQERQIATAVSGGATNKEVAAQLFISPRTVDYHLRKVYRKLAISSRAELIRVAVTEGALDDGRRRAS